MAVLALAVLVIPSVSHPAGAQLAAADAEVRLSDRELPAARDALASAEEAAQQARGEVDAMQARIHVLRGTVLTGEPDAASASLVELRGLVGDDPSGWLPR